MESRTEQLGPPGASGGQFSRFSEPLEVLALCRAPDMVVVFVRCAPITDRTQAGPSRKPKYQTSGRPRRTRPELPTLAPEGPLRGGNMIRQSLSTIIVIASGLLLVGTSAIVPT